MAKSKKRKFSISEEYKKSIKYIRDSKKFIYAAIGIFFFFVFFAYFIPAPQFLYDKIIAFIQDLVKQTQGMSQLQIIEFIISNNVKSTFFILIFGAIAGVFPLVSAVANGYMLGFVSFLSVRADGILTLWRLLPHGIFELPAVFISLGLGLKTGSFIFQKNKIKSLREYFIKSLKVFFLIIIPLLLIAGIIEGTLISLFS